MAQPSGRENASGLALNMALAVCFAAIGNGIVALLGWTGDPTLRAPSFQPPGVVIGVVWTILFAALGAARWLVTRERDAGRLNGLLVTILILACFAYPYYTLGFHDLVIGLTGSLATMLLAAATAWRVSRQSPLAAALVAPTALWCGFASVLLIRTLQLNP